MDQKIFWITSGQCCPDGDIIYARGSGLRIRVCRPDNYGWAPAPNEVQLYGCIGDEILVFETIATQPEHTKDIAAAIHWYATYYGKPEMLIFTQEPQPSHHYLHGSSHTP